LGYGRVEILTKPGLDQFHGQVSLNAKHFCVQFTQPVRIIPAGTQPPGYNSRQFSGEIGGPLVSTKASFFFNIERRDIDELSIVSARIVDQRPSR